MTARRALAAALAGLVLLAGCGGSSEPDASAAAPTTRATSTSVASTTDPAGRTVEERSLTGRRFWFGDDLGSLFRVDLDRVRLEAAGDGPRRLVLVGRATNELASPGQLELAGRVRAPDVDRPASSAATGAVAPGESHQVEIRADDLDPAVALDDLVLELGAAGATPVSVAFDATDDPDPPTEPQREVVPGDPIPLGGGATFRVTGSVLYPRFVTGRPGQSRLQITASVTVPEGSGPVFVHPSLTAPDGTTVSFDPSQVSVPGTDLVQSVALNPPRAGTYTLRVLDVATGQSATEVFRVG